MFAGRRRQSSNIRNMQLFHELKQQFPTVPDHILTSCISTHNQQQQQSSISTTSLRQIVEAAAFQEQMGRSPSSQPSPTLALTEQTNHHQPSPINEKIYPPPVARERKRFEMNTSCSDINQNVVIKPTSVSFHKNIQQQPKRPDHLDIKPESYNLSFQNSIQLSGKCKNVHKLLNEDNNICEKPPKSPSSAKRPITKRLVQQISTPTQTTDTLSGSDSANNNVNNNSANINLSLNVNCSMDLVQSPTAKPHKTVLQMTPTQPWLQEPVSPRSYNSVNFVIRPPSSEHQPPIDITSQNSSLTYSTSSFDSKKGLQSRLQITVGPSGSSCVASSRARPRSCYELDESRQSVEVPARAGSLNDLVTTPNSEPPVILQQQARIENLKIELRNEKVRLSSMRKEVHDLQDQINKECKNEKADIELERQLIQEVKHLQYQCNQLASKQHGVFYSGLYTGQRGPLVSEYRQQHDRLLISEQQQRLDATATEGDKWGCHMCTFLNHPDMNKCEECEMPRIHHVSAAPGENILIHVTPRLSRRITHSWVL